MKAKIIEQPATKTEQRLIFMTLIDLVERFFQEHPELEEEVRKMDLQKSAEENTATVAGKEEIA
mgnify:FL=1